MTRITKMLVFTVVVIAFLSRVVPAATYTAASCNESDVRSAYNTEQGSAQDGDVISIPAGSCTWAGISGATWSISPANSITFQGAGAETPDPSCDAKFLAIQSCTTTAGTDQTVITVQTAADFTAWLITTPATKSLRLTGIAWNFNCPITNTQNDVSITGLTQALRIDHSHLIFPVSNAGFALSGTIFGVIDHIVLDINGLSNLSNPIVFKNGSTWVGVSGGSPKGGDGSWNDSAHWGSNKFVFIESSILNGNTTNTGSYINDCSIGGRQVFRYNTYTGKMVSQGHEGTADNRGCRATEIYNNTDTQPASADNTVIGSTRTGNMMVWGNVGSWKNVVTLGYDRTNNAQGVFTTGFALAGQTWSGTLTATGTATVTWASGANYGSGQIHFSTLWPNESTPVMYINTGSGYVAFNLSSCASTTSCTMTTNVPTSGAGTFAWYAPSVWDQSAGCYTNTTLGGCIDQSGRGQGDLLSGSFTSPSNTRVNTANGCPLSPAGCNAWPNEAVEPTYIWGNTDTYPGDTAADLVGPTYPPIADSRDFYIDGMQTHVQTSSTSPFNGSNFVQTIVSWTANGTSLTLTLCASGTCTTGLSGGQYVNVVQAAAGTAGRSIRGVYVISSVTPTTIVVPYSFSDSSSTSQGWVSTPGIGYGTLANRPTTCTPLVAYWETDDNQLDQCSTANTWTAYYTPYTYPHPLTQSSSPDPPMNLAATAH